MPRHSLRMRVPRLVGNARTRLPPVVGLTPTGVHARILEEGQVSVTSPTASLSPLQMTGNHAHGVRDQTLQMKTWL